MDQVSLFEYGCFAESSASELFTSSMILLLQFTSPSRREFGYSGIFAVRLLWLDTAMNPGDVTVFNGHLFRIIGRMLGPVAIAIKPGCIHAQSNACRMAEQTLNQFASEQNIGVTTDKPIVHQVLGVHE